LGGSLLVDKYFIQTEQREQRLEMIRKMAEEGRTSAQMADACGVSRQRIYQILYKHNIPTTEVERKGFLRGKPTKVHWLNKMLGTKGLSKKERLHLLLIPDDCPALGIPLNYEGVETTGWARRDDSPSLDRFDSSKGYEVGNIHIISWRANRIKNDSTPEELRRLAEYISQMEAKRDDSTLVTL
jgi:hypothetical protein